jgi:hypothetical protein
MLECGYGVGKQYKSNTEILFSERGEGDEKKLIFYKSAESFYSITY